MIRLVPVRIESGRGNKAFLGILSSGRQLQTRASRCLECQKWVALLSFRFSRDKCIIIYLINAILKNYYHFIFNFFYSYPSNFECFYFKILKIKNKFKKNKNINNNDNYKVLIFCKLKLI